MGRRRGGKTDRARPCPESLSILAFQEAQARTHFRPNRPARLWALRRAKLPPQKDDSWGVDFRALSGKWAGPRVDGSLTFKYLYYGMPYTLQMSGAALTKKHPAQTLAHSRAQRNSVLVDGGR